VKGGWREEEERVRGEVNEEKRSAYEEKRRLASVQVCNPNQAPQMSLKEA
jgi:hypothetical protein